MDFYLGVMTVGSHNKPFRPGLAALLLTALLGASMLAQADETAPKGKIEARSELFAKDHADQFTSCCERLREAFANAEPVGVQVHNLSLSAGMTLLSAGDDLDEALQRADQALYRAKRGGRNRCDAAWEGAGA